MDEDENVEKKIIKIVVWESKLKGYLVMDAWMLDEI